MKNSGRMFIAVGAGAVLTACGASDQAADQASAPSTGHMGDGVYILNAEERQFTCTQFDEEVRQSIVAAFENVDEGNRKAGASLSSNIISLGLGGIPRGFDFGGGDRVKGRQELTRALALDSQARSQGCDGTDITHLMEQTLGEKGLLTATYGAGAMTVEEQILAEEQQRKNR